MAVLPTAKPNIQINTPTVQNPCPRLSPLPLLPQHGAAPLVEHPSHHRLPHHSMSTVRAELGLSQTEPSRIPTYQHLQSRPSTGISQTTYQPIPTSSLLHSQSPWTSDLSVRYHMYREITITTNAMDRSQRRGMKKED
jgi:hypothetical protein